MTGRVLIVDDERGVCETLHAALSKKGFTTAWRTSAEEGFELLGAQDFDVVVADIHMRGMGGLGLCERVAQNRPDLPVVVITAFGSFDAAVAAMRAGAYDFITKPFEVDALRLTLERAIRHGKLREEVKRLREVVADRRERDEILGASDAMRAVFDLIDRVAGSSASVLVTGESGTGTGALSFVSYVGGSGATTLYGIDRDSLTNTVLIGGLAGNSGVSGSARTYGGGTFDGLVLRYSIP